MHQVWSVLTGRGLLVDHVVSENFDPGYVRRDPSLDEIVHRQRKVAVSIRSVDARQAMWPAIEGAARTVLA
jgi:hypothetical protein